MLPAVQWIEFGVVHYSLGPEAKPRRPLSAAATILLGFRPTRTETGILMVPPISTAGSDSERNWEDAEIDT